MTRVSIDLPPGWLPLPAPDDAGAPAYAAAPANWPADYGIRPHLQVRLGEPCADSVAEAAEHTAATFLARHYSCHLVSWDLWRDESGRRLVMAYPDEGALVCATIWLRQEQDRVLSITSTVDADRYPRVQPMLDRAAVSVRLSGVPEGRQVAKPGTEPRLDEFWLDRGERLEDLGRFQRANPWRPADGIALSMAGFAALAEAGRSWAGRGRRVAAAAVPELAEVGLVDSGGRLTQDAESVWRVLANPAKRIRVEATAAAGPACLEVARLGSAAVVWATDSPTGRTGSRRPARTSDGPGPSSIGRLWRLPALQVPAALAQWLQVGPAWPFDLGSPSLPGTHLLERLEDPATQPPDGVDELLAAIWPEPWFGWTVTADNSHALTGVHAGRHGHLRVKFPRDEQVLHSVGAEPVTLNCLLPQALFTFLTELSLR